MVCSPDTDFAGVNGLFLGRKVERQQLQLSGNLKENMIVGPGVSVT